MAKVKLEWFSRMMVRKAIQRGIGFVVRQEKPFKINLLRVSTQNFSISLTQQYQSVYIKGLGASPFLLGILNSVGGLAAASVAIPTGWLADRHGIKRILLIGTLLLALGALIFALAPSWLAIAPALLIVTLALRVVMTVCPMVCGSCLRNEERATGMQFCDTLSAVPRLFSPMIGAVLVTMFGGMGVEGIRPLYYFQVMGFCSALVLTLREFSDPTPRETPKHTSNLVEGLRELAARGTMIKRWIMYISLSTIPMFVNPVYQPLFATIVKEADQFVLGGLAAASMVLPLLLSVPIGRLADTIGRKKVIYMTTPIHCFSLLLLVYAPDSTALLASGVLQGFYMLAAVTQGAMTVELVPPSLQGRWFGILGVFRGVTSVLAPAISAVIWSTVGPAYVFFFMILTELMKLFILATMPETLRRKKHG